jgi:hypothetical protein
MYIHTYIYIYIYICMQIYIYIYIYICLYTCIYTNKYAEIYIHNQYVRRYVLIYIYTGECHNAYNWERSPGGSSGGEGALISSYSSVLGIGTDIGGYRIMISILCIECQACCITTLNFCVHYLCLWLGLCVLRRTHRQYYETLFPVIILRKHHHHHHHHHHQVDLSAYPHLGLVYVP